MAKSVAEIVPFEELSGLLEKINKNHGTDNKKKVLQVFVDKWREFHDRMHQSDPNTPTDTFFSVMRLLLPQHERERGPYGIKEHMLAKHYIEILCLGKDSPDAMKLLNFRAPKNAKGDAGDFAGVAYFVLKNRCPERGTLKISEVNTALDNIAQYNAEKNKEQVRKNLLYLLRNMSALEQKWLIRMVMKELKVGLSQASVFRVYHEDAEDLFNVNGSLEKVCKMLRDPKIRMHEIEISLFSPFRPMLGERGAPNKVEKLMDNKAYIIETKFDGERMQLHKKGDEYRYFSRGGHDYTATYGTTPFDGNFTPYVANCFKPSVTDCILDGEMVGYDPETKTIRSKGENFDIKKLDGSGVQACMCVFDILLLNGKVLTNVPLQQRLDMLKDVFSPAEGRITATETTIGKTREDCVAALNRAIDGREEGIMVKNPTSIYRPNTRKGGWFKIKPEYLGGLMDELDLLIVGGNFGVGRGAGMMTHFLCAVAVPPEQGDKPTLFHSFCRVGSGYSRTELYEFNKKLLDHWRPYSKKNPPANIMLASGVKERPDCWIPPDKSFILQVKAAEIIDSDSFKTGCTLRFPRVEKIRYDKPWYDCMTTDDIVQLKNQAGGKLTGGFAQGGEEDEPVKKRRRIAPRQAKPSLMAQFRATDTSQVKQVSELFEGRELCVVNGSSSHPKSELEKRIVEFGGSIVQHPGVETFCVLADKVAVRVKNIISKDIYDVVKVDWLIRCVDSKKLLPWVPSDMIHASPTTTKEFALNYDRHGDSYIEDTSIEQLKKVFQKVEKEGNASEIDSEIIAEHELEYFPNDSPYGLFRLCRIYMDSNLVVGDGTTRIEHCSLELVALEARFYGASVVEKLDDKVTHVIVDTNDLSRVKELRNRSKSREKKFHIVTEDWLCNCIEAKDLLNERQYEPVAL